MNFVGTNKDIAMFYFATHNHHVSIEKCLMIAISSVPRGVETVDFDLNTIDKVRIGNKTRGGCPVAINFKSFLQPHAAPPTPLPPTASGPSHITYMVSYRYTLSFSVKRAVSKSQFTLSPQTAVPCRRMPSTAPVQFHGSACTCLSSPNHHQTEYRWKSWT
jgi:hypothetical protein